MTDKLSEGLVSFAVYMLVEVWRFMIQQLQLGGCTGHKIARKWLMEKLQDFKVTKRNRE